MHPKLSFIASAHVLVVVSGSTSGTQPAWACIVGTISRLEDDDALWIDRDDLSRMGLDTWSEADRAYVQEFVSLYFNRRVEIRGNEVDCCGLRVPLL